MIKFFSLITRRVISSNYMSQFTRTMSHKSLINQNTSAQLG